ncbi:MAG: glycosyltransferase family 9 protein [bacterium]
MSTALPRPLKGKFPDSSIVYLVKEYSKDVVLFHPFIDNVLIFNPSWLKDPLGKKSTLKETLDLLKVLRQRRFDIALVANADWKKALLAYLSRIPVRIGRSQKKAGVFLSEDIARDVSEVRHMLEDDLDLLRALEIETKDALPEVHTDPKQDALVDEFIKSKNIKAEAGIVGIHPSSLHASRNWEIEKFIELTIKLSSAGIGVFFFTPSYKKYLDNIVGTIKNRNIHVIRDITVGHMASYIKRCSVFVGNDSGPIHIAAAVGVRVAALFGPSDFRRFGPVGQGHLVLRHDMSCSPCGSSPDCDSLECIKSLSVDEVYGGLRSLLEKRR